mmetsp:Transcript_89356/g.178581  ORF Transcript_89356/g.178581 Transcript_89356/m.178581 type:complete len:91 (+) Transcript_89356:465-737(+)
MIVRCEPNTLWHSAAAAEAEAKRSLGFETGLLRARDFWRKYYQHQSYERQFLEFQSGIPFHGWRHLFRCVGQVAKTLAPSSPEQQEGKRR